MTIWQQIYQTFWAPSFWLPPNTKWSDVAANPRTHIIYNYYSGLLLPLPMALALLTTRFFVQKYIFAPFGKLLGVKHPNVQLAAPNSILDIAYQKCHHMDRKSLIGLTKRVDMTEREIERWWRIRRAQDKPTKLRKLNESLWRFLHYSISVAFGMFVLLDKSWLWEIKECWLGYPYQVLNSEIRWYYLFSIAAYWSQIASHFLDTRRKDFWMLIVHHIVALLLLLMSWICNFHRVGSLVLVTLDFAEIFLEAAKMAKFSNHHKLCNGIFIIFIIAWFAARLGLYLRIIYSAIFDVPYIFATFPAYYALIGMLVIVVCISLAWTYMILQIAFVALQFGEVKRDCRSSSSENSDSESNVSQSQTQKSHS